MNARKHKVPIREIFGGLQQQMAAKLSLNRSILKHAPTKGDASELEWVEMLSSYLPQRYQVAKAFVIDHEGSISDQIDIVIFDRHFSPFILKQNGALYVPAESVYAVVEVKPTITKQNLEYAANKAWSVRRLKRTSAAITQADARGITPRPAPRILGGLLALDGRFGKSIEWHLQNLSHDKCLNIGCSLSGSFFALMNCDPWVNGCTPHSIKVVNDNSNSLVLFFLQLLDFLREMGTVPAMDLEKYMTAISNDV